MTKGSTAILLLTLALLAACDNSQVETLNQEREALQRQVQELDAQVATFRTERDELQSRAEATEAERDELQSRVETTEAERNELQNRVETTEAERNELQTRVSELAMELEQAQQENVDLGAERDQILAGLQGEFEAQFAAVRRELRDLAGLVEVIEEERSQLRERLGEGVLPPLDSQEDAEPPAPITAEVNPIEQVNQLREQMEQLENQATQP